MDSFSFLTVQEVAKILKLSTLTIYEYIRSQKLHAARFGRTYRIQQKDLNESIKSHAVM